MLICFGSAVKQNEILDVFFFLVFWNQRENWCWDFFLGNLGKWVYVNTIYHHYDYDYWG